MREHVRWRWFGWATPASPPKEETGGPDVELVVVAVVDGPLMAEMALEALQAAQIPALLQRKPVATVYGFATGAWGAIPLLVPVALLAPAREVLLGMGLLTEQTDDSSHD